MNASSASDKNSIHPPHINYREGGFEILACGNFEMSRKGEARVQIKPSHQSFEITGDWDLSFPPGWGAPATAKFSKLISWTQSDDPGIKFFSGTGTYKKQFSYKPSAAAAKDESIYLDLGQASKVVEAWLNGKLLGISWTLPHRFNVSGLLKSGLNELRIEVINTWSNRIIGDINSEKKYTYTNLNVRGSRELLWTETPLTISGLLGPVRIETVKKIQVVR
ncbi:MAG: hypothetical protein EOP48_27205 [Sphingobacteriales bacterium]|nr:MAG: hypothetical protein EOP48_27205 [Sphingobacteriales bacterium]